MSIVKDGVFVDDSDAAVFVERYVVVAAALHAALDCSGKFKRTQSLHLAR